MAPLCLSVPFQLSNRFRLLDCIHSPPLAFAFCLPFHFLVGFIGFTSKPNTVRKNEKIKETTPEASFFPSLTISTFAFSVESDRQCINRTNIEKETVWKRDGKDESGVKSASPFCLPFQILANFPTVAPACVWRQIGPFYNC